MASTNVVVLMGNLTKAPEQKVTRSGAEVVTLRLAVNEKVKTPDGELKERALFIDVKVWGKQGSACVNHLDKGSLVLIEGKLQYEQWETEKYGKQSKITARAHRVQFLGGTVEKAAPSGGQSDGDTPKRDDPYPKRVSAAGKSEDLGYEDNLPF